MQVGDGDSVRDSSGSCIRGITKTVIKIYGNLAKIIFSIPFRILSDRRMKQPGLREL